MPDDKPETVVWWIGDGWDFRPEPEAYRMARTLGGRRAHGYELALSYGDFDVEDAAPAPAYTVEIYSHYGSRETAHLLVEVMGNCDVSLATFFVERAYEALFVVEKLPALLAGARP